MRKFASFRMPIASLIKKAFWLVLLVCIAGCQAPDQPRGISTTRPAVDSSSTAEAPSFNSRSQAYQLSYIQSGDLWLVDLSQPEILPRQVTEVGSIVRYGWAPDGRAFWYETLPGKLTVVDLSSGGEHAIAGETNAEATWSPDSAGIVYVSTIPDAGWSIGSPAYRTEVNFFDRTSLETTRLLGGTEPDLILDPPVRLQTWSMPRWNYARPLFINEHTILFDIQSKGSIQSDKETYLNFLGFLDLVTGDLDIKIDGGMPLEEDSAGFETYGVPLEWDLASDGRTLAIIQPFTQVSKDPTVSSGLASAWWVLDLESMMRQSIMPDELACDEIISNAPAAWGQSAGLAWHHQSPDLNISFWQRFVSLRESSTQCPVSNQIALYGLTRQNHSFEPTWKRPGAMEPVFTWDDSLLAFTTHDKDILPQNPDAQSRDILPPQIALETYTSLQLSAYLDPSAGNPEFVNALLDSARFAVHVIDQQQRDVLTVQGAHSPAWRPSPNKTAILAPSVAATITSTLMPTMIPIEATSTSIAPAGTPSPTPPATQEPLAPLTAVVTATTAFDTKGWVEHRLEEAGAQVSLPPDWILMRLSLAGYFARPNWVQNQTDPAAFALLIGIQGDVPYDLPGLTETQAYRLGENEPGPLTHEPIRLAGYEGVAFWDFAYVCMEAFVPADGVVHAVTVTPYLCQGEGADRQLKPEAQAMLESIRFFPPNPPPPDGLPVGGLPTPDE